MYFHLPAGSRTKCKTKAKRIFRKHVHVSILAKFAWHPFYGRKYFSIRIYRRTRSGYYRRLRRAAYRDILVLRRYSDCRYTFSCVVCRHCARPALENQSALAALGATTVASLALSVCGIRKRISGESALALFLSGELGVCSGASVLLWVQCESLNYLLAVS